MNYHIIKDKKVIFFWTPKCGVTSLVEMIMHIESGEDNSHAGDDEKTHKVYWKNFRKWSWNNSLDNEDFSNYTKILCARNTFHRVASCFLDKYVDDMSPSTDDVPDVDSFYEFVKILKSTKLEKNKMNGKVDYEHFCLTTESIGWEFYKKLGFPKFDYIFETPITALPEGKIVHDYRYIKKVYQLLAIESEYKKIKHLYERHWFSYDIWESFEPKIAFNSDNFSRKSIHELKKFHEHKLDRTIPYKNFYDDEMVSIIEKLYKSELDFYEKILNRRYHP